MISINKYLEEKETSDFNPQIYTSFNYVSKPNITPPQLPSQEYQQDTTSPDQNTDNETDNNDLSWWKKNVSPKIKKAEDFGNSAIEFAKPWALLLSPEARNKLFIADAALKTKKMILS